MKHIQVSYAEDAASGQPAMMDGIDQNICKMGIFARNIKTLVLEDIQVAGQRGRGNFYGWIDSLEWRK